MQPEDKNVGSGSTRQSAEQRESERAEAPRNSVNSAASGSTTGRKNIFSLGRRGKKLENQSNSFFLTGLDDSGVAESEKQSNAFDISQELIPHQNITLDAQPHPSATRKSFLPEMRQSHIELQHDILKEIKTSDEEAEAKRKGRLGRYHGVAQRVSQLASLFTPRGD